MEFGGKGFKPSIQVTQVSKLRRLEEGKLFSFEKLEVWKKAINLYAELAEISASIPKIDQFSLGEQIRRAALSISTNIAEGGGRNSLPEKKYFYNIAKGSVYEIVSLLILLKKKTYIDENKFNILYRQAEEIAKMLSGLLNQASELKTTNPKLRPT